MSLTDLSDSGADGNKAQTDGAPQSLLPDTDQSNIQGGGRFPAARHRSIRSRVLPEIDKEGGRLDRVFEEGDIALRPRGPSGNREAPVSVTGESGGGHGGHGGVLGTRLESIAALAEFQSPLFALTLSILFF